MAAQKSISFPRLSQILMFRLQVFGPNMEKLTPTASPPLTMECFCNECKLESATAASKDGHQYHLNAVIVHVGLSSKFAHYIAYVRLLTPVPGQSDKWGVKLNPFAHDWQNLEKNWFKCNDEEISRLTEDQFTELLVKGDETPYLLFYSRKDLIDKYQKFEIHTKSKKNVFEDENVRLLCAYKPMS